MTSPTEEIRDTMEGILEAYVDHDLERFQSFFADDIVALRPGAPTMLGSEWNQFTERVFAYLSVSKMSIEPIDITIVSDDQRRRPTTTIDNQQRTTTTTDANQRSPTSSTDADRR